MFLKLFTIQQVMGKYKIISTHRNKYNFKFHSIRKYRFGVVFTIGYRVSEYIYIYKYRCNASIVWTKALFIYNKFWILDGILLTM